MRRAGQAAHRPRAQRDSRCRPAGGSGRASHTRLRQPANAVCLRPRAQLALRRHLASGTLCGGACPPRVLPVLAAQHPPLWHLRCYRLPGCAHGSVWCHPRGRPCRSCHLVDSSPPPASPSPAASPTALTRPYSNSHALASASKPPAPASGASRSRRPIQPLLAPGNNRHG